MAKINFQQFEVWDGIARRQKRVVDVREAVGDLIYRNAAGIRGHSLAHKVYESKEALEYTNEEIVIIKNIVELLCIGPIIDGLNEQLANQNKEA